MYQKGWFWELRCRSPLGIFLLVSGPAWKLGSHWRSNAIYIALSWKQPCISAWSLNPNVKFRSLPQKALASLHACTNYVLSCVGREGNLGLSHICSFTYLHTYHIQQCICMPGLRKEFSCINASTRMHFIHFSSCAGSKTRRGKQNDETPRGCKTKFTLPPTPRSDREDHIKQNE